MQLPLPNSIAAMGAWWPVITVGSFPSSSGSTAICPLYPTETGTSPLTNAHPSCMAPVGTFDPPAFPPSISATFHSLSSWPSRSTSLAWPSAPQVSSLVPSRLQQHEKALDLCSLSALEVSSRVFPSYTHAAPSVPTLATAVPSLVYRRQFTAPLSCPLSQTAGSPTTRWKGGPLWRKTAASSLPPVAMRIGLPGLKATELPFFRECAARSPHLTPVSHCTALEHSGLCIPSPVAAIRLPSASQEMSRIGPASSCTSRRGRCSSWSYAQTRRRPRASPLAT
mmetsp:Transcript_7806/g.17935  ORF Transcript_7806/g.17935 Transcript_7806/m.17935 type:complete len:281 (+) Transcript_7806:972-1814(+)